MDTKWKDLYKIGGISFIITTVLILFAIIGFFIWPYSPSENTTADILTTLDNDIWKGLFSLDLIMLITMLVNIFPLLALYVSLKNVNESYALIAFVLALIGVATIIPARPLQEMVILSEKYARAKTEIERNIYLASGETYLALFDGTAWLVQTVLLMLSGLINALLMLKSKMFSKTTAWIGIIAAALGFGFFIPKIGVGFLFINTILTIPFYILIALVFIKIGWHNKINIETN